MAQVSTEGDSEETSSEQALPIRSLQQGTIAGSSCVALHCQTPQTMNRSLTLAHRASRGKPYQEGPLCPHERVDVVLPQRL